ncbi:hypothetical protein [Ralstonia sp. 1B3]|uniref:hypothetical protein n=1 Tax=Ralstonia sp. 1B3 TaxID=2997421 RepID=UPI003FA78213
MSCALPIPPPLDWPALPSVLRPLQRWLAPLGLRIDVEHGSDDIERELDTLYERMQTPGTPLHGMACDDGTLPGFRLHTRGRRRDLRLRRRCGRAALCWRHGVQPAD